MKIIYSTVLIFIFSVFKLSAENTDYYPIWTYHQDSVNIHGISIGLITTPDQKATYTNGIKIELIGLGILAPLAPKGLFSESDSEHVESAKKIINQNINGLSLSLSGTVNRGVTNGICAGGVGIGNYQINGISGAFLMNQAEISNGVQFAIFTSAYKANGLQAGIFMGSYYTRGVILGGLTFSKDLKGIQIGFYNNSLVCKGLQIGLYNNCENLNGLQIGLWNVNQNRSTPFVNW